jgi:hypothetical protein
MIPVPGNARFLARGLSAPNADQSTVGARLRPITACQVDDRRGQAALVQASVDLMSWLGIVTDGPKPSIRRATARAVADQGATDGTFRNREILT